MIVTPNFDEALESGPVLTGIYKARITDAELKKSRKGEGMINWKLTIFGAEGDYATQNNRPVFVTTMTEGKGAGMLKEFARKVLGQVPQAWDTDQFLSREVEIKVESRYNDDGTVSNYPDVKVLRALS